MGFPGIPGDPGRLRRARQHRLTEGQSAERGGIEGAEGMKRIALHSRSLRGGIDERQIEPRVVTDQNGAAAVAVSHRLSDRLKNFLQNFVFRQGVTKRMVRVDTGKGKRCRIEIGAREGLDVTSEGLMPFQAARLVHAQGDGGDFQQGIGLRVESRRLHVYRDGQETAKTLGHGEGIMSCHGNRIRDLPEFCDGVNGGLSAGRTNAVKENEMTMMHALSPGSGKWRRGCMLSIVVLWLGAVGCAWALSDATPIAKTAYSDYTSKNEKTLLWKVERSGLRPSYVFATINSEDPRVTELPPAVVQAFQLSNVFAMELIPDHAAMARMSSAMFINDGPDLKSLLGEAYFKKAAAVMGKGGITPELLDKLKPWVVFTALTMPKPEDGLFLDVVLYGAALNDGKNVHGLETADEQVAIFEGIRLDDQVAILKEVIDHYPMLARINKEIVNRYTEGDLGAVAALQDEYLTTQDQHLIHAYRQHVIDDRNLRIVDRILPRIEEQNAFIAIDAGLLPGDHGVLHLLEQRGYQISPVY